MHFELSIVVIHQYFVYLTCAQEHQHTKIHLCKIYTNANNSPSDFNSQAVIKKNNDNLNMCLIQTLIHPLILYFV